MSTPRPIKLLIADDEALARARLRQLLQHEPGVEIVAEAANGVDALDAIRATQPDVVLLDLRMPEVDGLAVAEAIKDQPSPLIVFVTAHEISAPAAFAARACDYLLKPCSPARLRESLARVRERLAAVPLPESTTAGSGPLQRLMVRNGERMVVVAADEIDWFESANNYVILHVGRTTHILRETLTELEARLEPRNFLRLSRAAAVNPKQVREIAAEDGGHNVVLRDGTRISVTRRIREIQALLETI